MIYCLYGLLSLLPFAALRVAMAVVIIARRKDIKKISSSDYKSEVEFN